MVSNVQKIDRHSKLSLLARTLGLAIFVVLVLNVLISIVYILELIKAPDYDTISLSFNGGYYTINEEKMGASIAFNCIGILFLWFTMVVHTLKSINRSLSYIL